MRVVMAGDGLTPSPADCSERYAVLLLLVAALVVAVLVAAVLVAAVLVAAVLVAVVVTAVVVARGNARDVSVVAGPGVGTGAVRLGRVDPAPRILINCDRGAEEERCPVLVAGAGGAYVVGRQDACVIEVAQASRSVPRRRENGAEVSHIAAPEVAMDAGGNRTRVLWAVAGDGREPAVVAHDRAEATRGCLPHLDMARVRVERPEPGQAGVGVVDDVLGDVNDACAGPATKRGKVRRWTVTGESGRGSRQADGDRRANHKQKTFNFSPHHLCCQSARASITAYRTRP